MEYDVAYCSVDEFVCAPAPIRGMTMIVPEAAAGRGRVASGPVTLGQPALSAGSAGDRARDLGVLFLVQAQIP